MINKIFFRSITTFFLFIFLSTMSFAAMEDQYWPMEITSPHGKILVYQPQPETFKDNVLTGRAAVSVTLNQKTTPAFGAIWFTAILTTDLDKRTFDLQRVKVTKVKFPETSPDEAKEFTSILTNEVPKNGLHGSLDSLLATLENVQKESQVNDNLQTTPPKIIFLKYPAQLIYIDGEPKLQAIENSKLMRVVNTPMLMVFDATTKKYYLSSGTAWYSAADVNGSWQIDHNLPDEVEKMLTDNGKPVQNTTPDAKMPRIVVATTPTELIVSDGEPQYSPIKGTNLLYLSNSDNDVFLDIDSQVYYVLISGRWYSSKSLDGEWSYVSADKLPADFANIPPSSVKANVLISVPKTTQADDALIAAEVPQTAIVERSKATLTVTYDGEPKFIKIKGTDMQYAANTATPVLLIAGKYYACDNAVWFVAPTPQGPWIAADSIPNEIQKIPPESPVYNVKYVYVYNSTPDVIYTGYTAGYMGWYPYYGTVVFGTGYPYPAWYGSYYYPRPVTYGFAVHYNSFTDSWAFGFRWSNGFNTIAFGWNNWWGNHGWFFPGPYIHHPVFINNNININNVNVNNINRNFPNRISVGNKTFNINRDVKNNIYNWRENENRLAPGSRSLNNINREAMTNLKNRENNILTDKDGNIYRVDQNRWQKHDGNKWSPVAEEQNANVNQAKQKIEQRREVSTSGNVNQAKQQVLQHRQVSPSRSSAEVRQTITQKHNAGSSVVPGQVVHDYQARQRGVQLESAHTRNFSRSTGFGSRGGLIRH